ncbi:MAG: hypothetical protein A3I66_03370 [Burkholderiales bacterium RIFCSPLOWO2_02_FULL_57_36]|nr:MAG: hypothetical protein A3I66_03370 [Burkholderiales bacterium RIFCSPLOWO2_02_FULL_57_36]
MKLIYSPPSPYARKVLVLAHEIEIFEKLEHVRINVAPTVQNDEIAMWNPLGKVPALILETGEALFDSRVICDYLEQKFRPDAQVVDENNELHWMIKRMHALADGILDAALLVRYEITLRPADKRWADWIDGQMRKIRNGLNYLEKEAPICADRVNIGQIALGCTLGYLDFRFEDENWRSDRPNLSAFYDQVSSRPSMKKTKPV